jgi:HEAT repeat protein
MRTADLNGTWECWMAFRRIGQAARPYVLEGLQDPDEFRRASAVAALSAIGDTGDVSVFVEALQDPGRYGRVRIRAAEALTEIPHAAAVPALIKALQDEHESVRVEAVSALGACGDTASVVPQMALALADVSPRVQGRAWGVLAEMESAAIPVLEELLVDPREPVRFGAATALLEVDENSYPQSRDLPRRILLLPGVPPERKADALETLEKAHFPLPPPADLCRKLRKEPDTRLRQAATDVLRCLKDRKTGRGRWRILRLTRI